MNRSLSPENTASDADLVAASRGGDRDAFRQIVERYQRLLCSIAYASTGKVGQSEDLAQEAFLEAWRQLDALREPEKLRPWLCGILRFKVSRLRRSERHEPLRHAEALTAAGEVVDEGPTAAGMAVAREEQAMLWAALSRLPALYREPLVLFYREHNSIEHVAGALELSEDAVKQRLARGRKLLQEQVLAFVAGALSRSTPGTVFTLGVLAALPAVHTTAKAAGVAAAAVHGGAMAKSTGIATVLSSLSGLVSAALVLRANLDLARTPRERRITILANLGFLFAVLAGMAALIWLRDLALAREEARVGITALSQALILGGFFVWPWALLRLLRYTRAMRTEERALHPGFFQRSVDQPGSRAGEYRSRSALFGIPWVRIRFAPPEAGDPPVLAWIAGGDRAYGLLFAWGGVAVAPLSIGAVSIGLISIGTVSFGLLSCGTAAMGLFAFGCVAWGVDAMAWLSATGWNTAGSGGFSISAHAAAGPVAFGPHANDPTAQARIAELDPSGTSALLIAVMAVAAVVPIAAYTTAVRARMGPGAGTGGSPSSRRGPGGG